MSIYSGWCDVEVVAGDSITLRVPSDVDVKPGKIIMLLYETEYPTVLKDTSFLNKINDLTKSVERDDAGVRFKRALEQSAKEMAYMVQNVPADVLGRALELYEKEIEDNPVREIREASQRG